MIKIYNTLTERKDTLRKSSKRPIRLFVCGPTVYDDPHIGNMRTFTAFDIIVRYLRSRGIQLFYLQNITDIDDKIIARAQEQNTSWEKVARHYEEIFHALNKELHITSVSKYARATDYIPQIVHQVKVLLKKGHAYKIEGDGYYFDLSTFPDYGKLAHRTVEQAEDGTSRIDASDHKRNRGDFCIWKLSKPGEPSWDTELGRGRPGWHIEDTAITEHFFGPQYDLHGGALDLKFPHHEAEIAQQESASGKKPFVKIWMHAGFLTVGGQKMSKSLGNFVTIPDLLKKYSANIFRMMVLLAHYRSTMDYSDEIAIRARKNLYDIGALLAKLAAISSAVKKGSKINLKKTEKAFARAMEDDFNTPQALAAIFELMNETNAKLDTLSTTQAKEITAYIKDTFAMLGIDEFLPKVPPEVTKLVQMRELLRRNKQFTNADDLRRQIEALGYIVEDTPRGPLALPKN